MAKLLDCGDTALTVEFGDRAEAPLSALVLALDRRLSEAGLRGVVEAVPTMRSLTIHYDPNLVSSAEIARALEPLLEGLEAAGVPGRRWLMPACYAPEVAPDIEDVARRTGLGLDDVARLHASVPYRVLMLGFLPGLPYLGDLPGRLRLPRRDSPRTAVPAGSVAIATTQTCIYPLESPGGWHLIARTPVRLFDAARDPPVLLAPGDEVSFRPIAPNEYEDLVAASRDRAWRPEPEGARP